MHATRASLTTGFLASVALTLGAYVLATRSSAGGLLLGALLLGLALVQLGVQMAFFLHVGLGAESRWKRWVLGSTFGMILLVIAGSAWIMWHLNYVMMASPDAMMHYIEDQRGF